jgi:hypothetical protein
MKKLDALMTKVKGGVQNMIKEPKNMKYLGDSRKQCLKNAKGIFHALLSLKATSDDQCLTLNEFLPLFETKEEAAKAFNLFDVDKSGEATKQEFRSCMLRVYDERKAIENSLRDFGNVIGSLDTLMKIVWGILVVLLSCVIFRVNLETYLATFGSILLASTFLFSNAAQTVFDAIVFLMIT